MIRTFEALLQGITQRILTQLNALLPPLVVAVLLIAVFFVLAIVARWVLAKAIKGARMDRFLADSGLSSMLHGTGEMRSVPLVAGAAFWLILAVGVLLGLSVFETNLTSRMVEGAVLLFPKLVTAGAILLAGFWLARFLGHSILVWAVNEEIPAPRRVAALTRVMIVFVAVVVAAEVLGFAPHVFFAAFVIVAGAAALALSLALGLGGRDAVRRYLETHANRSRQQEEGEKSLWNHL
jgi:hypothetical protein